MGAKESALLPVPFLVSERLLGTRGNVVCHGFEAPKFMCRDHAKEQ